MPSHPPLKRSSRRGLRGTTQVLCPGCIRSASRSFAWHPPPSPVSDLNLVIAFSGPKSGLMISKEGRGKKYTLKAKEKFQSVMTGRVPCKLLEWAWRPLREPLSTHLCPGPGFLRRRRHRKFTLRCAGRTARQYGHAAAFHLLLQQNIRS